MTDKKTITVRDLKTFIDAVEFASDQDEWIPSAKQWRRIREMIDSLQESQPAVQQPQFYPPQSAMPAPTAAPVMAAPQQPAMPTGPSAFATTGYAAVTGMPTGAVPAMPNNPLFGTTGTGQVRTPDIDTSHGKPYQSSFA